LETSLSLDTSLKFNRRIPKVVRIDTHMVTVAQIIVAEIAVLYAFRKPVRTVGEAVKVVRLRGPALITVGADMVLVYFETSLMSLLTSRFSPIETAMALILSELDRN